MAMNLAVAINIGGQQGGCSPYGGGGPIHGPHHHHRNDGCRGNDRPEKPDRNPFLDFLTAPLQALGKGGNQNDKEYDKYMAANQGCNLLKG
jgi:hypothetical protein